MFIDVFKKLCAEKGVSPSRALLDLDMGKSSVTRWRGGGEPSNSTKKKLADYFGVSVSELMSGEVEQKEKAPTQEGERELPHATYREVLCEDGMRLLLDADAKIPQEHLDEIVEFIKFKQQKYGR